MKILSQDRNILVNFDNIVRIYVHADSDREFHITCVDTDRHAFDLATYDDESIAREVLFKIFNCTADSYMVPK